MKVFRSVFHQDLSGEAPHTTERPVEQVMQLGHQLSGCRARSWGGDESDFNPMACYAELAAIRISEVRALVVVFLRDTLAELTPCVTWPLLRSDIYDTNNSSDDCCCGS
jgi:hypothetical protein